MKSDLHNSAVAEEAYFVSGNTYKACTACTGTQLQGFNATNNVTVNTGGGASSFTLTAKHANCAGGDTWTYTSTGGTITGGPCT